MIFDLIFISIRVRRKIRTLFLRKHAKTIPWRYQQLVRYSYNIAGKTLVFTRNVNNHEMDRKTVYQIVRFISQFSMEIHIKFSKRFYSTVLCSLGSS